MCVFVKVEEDTVKKWGMKKEQWGQAGAFKVHANIVTTKEVSSKDHSVLAQTSGNRYWISIWS